MSSRPRSPTGAGAPAGVPGAAPDPFLARLEDRLGQGPGTGEGDSEEALTNPHPEALTNAYPAGPNGKAPQAAPPLPKPAPMRATARPPAGRPMAGRPPVR